MLSLLTWYITPYKHPQWRFIIDWYWCLGIFLHTCSLDTLDSVLDSDSARRFVGCVVARPACQQCEPSTQLPPGLDSIAALMSVSLESLPQVINCSAPCCLLVKLDFKNVGANPAHKEECALYWSVLMINKLVIVFILVGMSEPHLPGQAGLVTGDHSTGFIG